MAGRLRASLRNRERKDGTVAYTVRLRGSYTETTRTFTTARARSRFVEMADRYGIERALEYLEGSPESQAPVTLAEYAARSVDGRDLAPSTEADYRRYVEKDLGELGAIPVQVITRQNLASWIEWRTRQGDAPKTVANKHGFVASVLNDAVRDGLIATSPAQLSRLPKGAHHEMVCLSPQQGRELLSIIPPHYRPFIQFMMTTGLRFGEATALTATDVDLTGLTVRVNKAWRRKKGGGWEVERPKTPASIRTVAITPQMSEMLAPLAVRGRPHIFLSATGRPIDHGTFTRRIWEPGRALANGEEVKHTRRVDAAYRGVQPLDPGIGAWPRIHDLRHTAASWWLAAGVEIHVVKNQLGHKSIQTTVDTYGHLLPGAHDAARAGMARYAALLG